MRIITWEFWESQAFLPSQCSPHGKVQNILYRGGWWPPPKSRSCECSESKASPWFKIGSFSTNHLHCSTCQWGPNNLFTRCSWRCHFILIPNPELLHTLLSTFFCCYHLRVHFPSLVKNLKVHQFKTSFLFIHKKWTIKDYSFCHPKGVYFGFLWSCMFAQAINFCYQ
jgi:hypothetical protein